jgi:hypothetical protein
MIGDILCSIDKQLVVHLIMFPYLEAAYRTIHNLTLANAEILEFTEARQAHVNSILERWI